jgi:CysZ protein
MGIARGAISFLLGTWFVVATPRVWSRALVPVATCFLLLAAFAGLGIWGAFSLAHHLVGSTLGAEALGILFAIPTVLVALLLAVALAQPLSGWALETIVREQQRELGLPSRPHPARGAALSSLAAALGALAIGLPILASLTVASWLLPPAAAITWPLKLIAGALLLGWDLADYPFALEGVPVRERLKWCGRNAGALLGFGLCATLLFSLPGVGLLALPGGVAGATRLIGLSARAKGRAGPSGAEPKG